MSTPTPDAFDTALTDVFEGRECQFGHGPRKILREFYDRAQKDARGGQGSRATPVSQGKIGNPVRRFSDLIVGDVFQNDFLRDGDRCRRVIQVVDSRHVVTELVNTRTKDVAEIDPYVRRPFEEHRNYRYIKDPAS